MSISINTNTVGQSAINAFRSVSDAFDRSLEKIASGKSINRAADDASGMVIADTLKNAALSMGQRGRNAMDSISMVQIKESALGQAVGLIQGIGEMAVQAASDTQTPETRRAIQEDVGKSMQALTDIYKGATFNSQPLLSNVPGLAELSELDLSTMEGAEAAQEAVGSALEVISSSRSDLGARQNQLKSEVSNLGTMRVQTMQSASQIEDVDIAEEVMNMKRLGLLGKTSIFAQSQAANIKGQRVAALLGG
ncbi:MAG: hypothetical protein GY737_28640 [Desulfobacteraceae bacterium]|nr:hypothetical protein [Desulfobacteraceae bacterium]